MGLNQEQLYKHIQVILQSQTIYNKIVVLCEGNIQTFEGHSSPQAYRKMEQMPDANFYKRCIPTWWKQRQPRFFNCGDRNGVIDTYFGLLEQHHLDSKQSYLNPDKLFAIVDLDIQPKTIEDEYPFDDIEAIFNHLYQNAKVNETNMQQHRLWVTGFIHKEAYFLLPNLQKLFNQYPIPPVFDGIDLNLETVYQAMANTIDTDPDLQHDFDRVCTRFGFCQLLNCENSLTLKQSWLKQFKTVTDTIEKDNLIAALLMITKAKPFWHQIIPHPNSDWTRTSQAYREQLLLEIGRFISEKQSDGDFDHHLAVFFKNLYQFI